MKEDPENQKHLKRLILQAKEGDELAFEEVYTRYYTPLFRYILSRIKDRSEAEDMTQTVFLKIWNAIPSWNASHTSPLSFFFTVARNSMIDYFRKSARREIVSDEKVQEHVEQTSATDKSTDARELHEILREAISKLTDEQQEIINFIYESDLTYKEIAEITGKREDAIRQQHSRAVKKLRQLYQDSLHYYDRSRIGK